VPPLLLGADPRSEGESFVAGCDAAEWRCGLCSDWNRLPTRHCPCRLLDNISAEAAWCRGAAGCRLEVAATRSG